MPIKRGTKFWVRGCDGAACGPFRWTDICGWVAAGQLTPADEVRLPDATDWSRIESIPELLTPPPRDEANASLTVFLKPTREPKPLGPRATAYLKTLGCPIPPARLNPLSALPWIRLLEELNPSLVDRTEHWAADEEANGRVPSGSPDDATAAQIATLRARGVAVPAGLTRRDAQRLISGPPTDGQLRRLQFYGIALPEGAGKDEAAELIDRHMRENWDSEQAYQAYKKTAATEGSGGQKPGPALRLRPSVEAELRELNPPLAALPPAPPAVAPRIPPASESQPAPVQKVIMIFAVAVLILAVTTVALTRKQPARADSPTPGVALKAEADRVGAVAPRPPKATILEAPNLSRAERLKAIVLALELTGIVGGAEPRVMIAGRMHRVGDVVDESDRVVVLQVDVSQNSVTFGDAAGNIVQRPLK